MERELTINNSVCGRWFLSLIALLLMSVGMQAEDYGLIVGGVSVTDGNASNITGDNITAGTVSFSNGTLTLNGATIQGPIVSSSNSGLTVHLVGRNTITTSQGVVPFQSSVTASLKFTAASGGMLLTNTPRSQGDVIIWSGFNDLDDEDIPNGYAFSWDANEYCNLGEYYKLFLKSLEFQYLGAQYVTAANCDNLLKNQSTAKPMVYYDATENVLTLDNANVDCSANESGAYYYLINKVYGNENLKINLVGNNFLDADVEVGLAWGDNLTFTTNTANPGMLTVWRGETYTPFIDGTGTTYANGLGCSYIEELNKYVIQTGSESYNLWIDGEQVTSANKDAICSGQVSEGVITFDGDHTLTFNNIPWNCFDSQYPFIKTSMDLTVHLVGTSQPDMGNVFITRMDGDNETHTLTFTTDPTNPGQFLVRGGSWSHEGFTVVYENDLAENPDGYYEEGDGDKPYAWIAQQSLGLKVAGTVVTAGNAANVLGGETSTVSFDATTNTLTLNEVWIDASNNEAIVSDLANLTIFLVGENGINGSNGFTFNKSSSVEKATITFTTDEESNGSLYIYNLEERLFGAGVTPAYTDVSIKHDGDSHTIDSQLGIRVGGVPVTLFNKDNVLGDGKVSYNAETYTLTLNNATIEPEEETSGIDFSHDEDFTIALIGNNSVRGGEGCTAISHSYGVETPNLYFAKGDATQHFSLTLIAQSKDDLIDRFYANYGDFFVFDNEDDGTYTSTISSSVFGGTGTAAEPFLIKTAEDLKDFAYHYNEGRFSNNVHIQLFNDIDCKDEEGFTTIANNTDATFYGVFDGNNKTISNLTMTGIGLFGYVSKDDEFGVGTIKDLTLSNINLTGESGCDATGGIVAELSDGAVVSNCSVENSIIACATNESNPEVGGIVGCLNNSTVTGCTVKNVQVKAETTYTGSRASSYAGGIAGNVDIGTVSACEVENATIRSSHVAADGYQSAGGIVGSCEMWSEDDITISNNSVKGTTTVSAEDNTPEGESGTPFAGAIVGQLGATTTLSNNTYEYSVAVSTKPSDAVASTVRGYQQRGSGSIIKYEGSDNYPELYAELNDVFEDNGAVMYTQKVTLPAESEEASVMGADGTYYSTVVESDVLSILVAPGQTATLNAIPGEGLAIASFTATNTTTSEAITTTATIIEGNETQYTFTMPDAPVNVFLTTAAAYGITVAGVAVTELNYSDVLGDHKVSFDVETSTLTLNGATINGNVYYSLEDELTVHLLGQNVIDGGWSEDADGLYAFVCESENASLAFTTDDENPGQLLMKNTYRNKWGYAQYYTDGFSWNKTYKNGLVEGYSSDEKHLIAVRPTITPGEGLYWTDLEYTITDGAQISCSDNQGHSVDVTVNANSFTLTGTGKYTISISKAVTLDDSNFSLSNSGCYIVHNKPTYSIPEGTYNDELAVKIENLPTLPENATYYPQVWYYLNDDEEHPVQLTSAEQTIAVTESTKVCVYFIDEDSGKVVKSAPVEAEYTIIAKTQLNISYAQNSRTWASYCATEKSLETPEGLQAYVVKQATKTGVQVEAIDYIPQGVGVLLKRTADNISEPIMAKAYMEDETETYTSDLVGTTASTPVKTLNGTVYVLYNDGFTRTTSGSIGAHRGYLLFAGVIADARLSIFEDETTAIKNVNSEATNNHYYNINGQRVATPKKNGLYIVDGQKRIVK